MTPRHDATATLASAPHVERSGPFGRWAHRHARWLFPAPAVLLVAAIIAYPIVYTVWMSLQEWFASSLTPPKFIGLAGARVAPSAASDRTRGPAGIADWG